jgi:N utilization substance protein B
MTLKAPRISPQVRRRARERAVQLLFGLEFTGNDVTEASQAFWADHPARPGVKKYAQELVQGIAEHQAELDAAIVAALDNWSLERVGRVECNILRVALFEMRYMADVPIPVAINEAIEVAKRYGPDDAPRFVNGVLDRLKESVPRSPDT